MLTQAYWESFKFIGNQFGSSRLSGAHLGFPEPPKLINGVCLTLFMVQRDSLGLIEHT